VAFIIRTPYPTKEEVARILGVEIKDMRNELAKPSQAAGKRRISVAKTTTRKRGKRKFSVAKTAERKRAA